MDNEVIAMALRMIGKNIMLIADGICKEEPSAVEEKPKKRTKMTAKEEPKLEVVKDEAVQEAEPVPEEEKKPEIAFQQVRAVLAQKSREGYTSAVKNIIEYFGAGKLSDIKPEHYAEVLSQAEMIGYE